MWIKPSYYLLGLFMLPLYSAVYAQGINFEETLTWEQVKEKARNEQKYIFLDCYATWCGPCKQMEKEVYTSQKVGEFFNNKFISIKLQFDSTKNDNEYTQQWHALTQQWQQQYKITAFPTYLFCTPDGKMVNKQIGYQTADNLLTIATNSLDPEKQYFTLIENYRAGKKKYNLLANLASKANYFGETVLADSLAKDYINNYLLTLCEEQLYTKDNITFIGDFLSTKDGYFDLFYHHRDKIDSVMNLKYYAQGVVDLHIYNELIYPFVVRAIDEKSTPDWISVEQGIRKKYGKEDAKRIILDAKLKWYPYKKDWKMFCSLMLQKMTFWMEDANHTDLYTYNQYAWWMFKYCDDINQLEMAISWADRAIELCNTSGKEGFAPNFIDTKANILYKLGRKNDAIITEERAINLAKQQKNDSYVAEFTGIIEKMKNGEPAAWVIPINVEK